MRNVLTSKLPKKKEEEEEKYHLDYIGEDGYVYKHNGEKYYKTGIFLQGPKGLPGVKGKDGLIPRIGENGNWFIGDTDTFVKAALDTSLYATKKDLDDLIDNAPEVLNTLKELANAIGDDANFATNINNRLTDIENVAYQVPVGGIPESDLSQGVKDKLNEKEVFWATYGTTTAAEIDAAVAAGKEVLCLYGNIIYAVTATANGGIRIFFSAFSSNDRHVYLTLDRNTNNWSNSGVTFQNTSNKVTSFQSTPDNTHYPSEKLVKDSLDTKADIGDILFANFSRLTPKKTFEYDVSDTAYHPLFSRANTGISQLMSEVDDIVKFRITVTGTNIYARVDVVVRFQPALTPPAIMVWNEPHSTSLSITGLFTLSNYYPKVLNSGNGWYLLFNTYNNTARHIKVEVYEDTENIAWIETKEELTYISSNWSVSGLEMHSTVGLGTNLNWRLKDASVGNSVYAQYLNIHLDTWLSNTLPIAGEALVKNGLVVMSGQKLFKATNKTVPVDCDCGVMLCINSNVAVNSAPVFSSISQKYSWIALTGDPALTKDTFARGDQVYLRCTLGQDGKIYPDGHLSNVKSAGYTWVHIGTAASATAINLDTCGKPFITLNNDGKVTHINGTQVMDSSMSKWGVVSQTQTWSGTYSQPRTYVMSNLVYGWIPQANIDLFVSAGAVFNDTTGYFEFNGLTDISYEEMRAIYNIGACPPPSNAANYFLQGRPVRTNIPFFSPHSTSGGYGRIMMGSLCRSSRLERVTFFSGTDIYTDANLSYAFYDCKYLTTIINVLKTATTGASSAINAFYQCYNLQNISLQNIRCDLDFKYSSLLSLESIVYMVQNAANTSAITITLHADAYARCQADTTEYTYSGQTYTGILALATAKNITIAT